MNSRARGRYARGGDLDVSEDQREQLIGQEQVARNTESVNSTQGLTEESGTGALMVAKDGRTGKAAVHDGEESPARGGGAQVAGRAMSRGKVESKFYTKQLDRVYSSNISIQGRLPADIVAELNHTANLIAVAQVDKQALEAIKTEEAIVPDLIAKDVAEEINSGVEFKSLDQLKEFLSTKRQALTKAHVELAKRSDAYQNIEHDLDVEPTHGKQIELTADQTGQVYIICKFNDNFGPNLHIYPFDIQTGQIDEGILKAKLVTTIGGPSAAAQPKAKDEDIMQPLQGLVAAPEYNSFNKLYATRNEFLYYFSIVNDYEKEEQALSLMRFSLITKQVVKLRNSVIKKQTVVVERNDDSERVEKKTPFGIVGVAFQEEPADSVLEMDQQCDEMRFLDGQFLLVIGEGYRAVSLRKLNDLAMNLLYFESEVAVTWSLYMHEKTCTSPNYPLTIGGVQKCKTYTSLISGNLSRENGRSWIFSKYDSINEYLELELKERYKSMNHYIYTSESTESAKLRFSKKRINDPGSKSIINFMKTYGVSINDQPDDNLYKQLLYLSQSFQYDAFLILQDYDSDKTYILNSRNGKSSIRVMQMKTDHQAIVFKPWNQLKAHPITRIQYKHGINGAHLVQVHPLFPDIVSNGECFLSYDECSEKLTQETRAPYKPMYYEEFFDGSDSNFSSEHPSTIFQGGHDDRQIVPRLGIEEKANDTITFIDVHEVKYQQQFYESNLRKHVRHDTPIQSVKRKLLINAWRYGWKELQVSGRQGRTSLQPSSPIEQLDELKKMFKQNWQVCVVDESQLVIYIYEYQFIWSEMEGLIDKDDFHFTYAGKILVVLKQPWTINRRINFLPYYPNNDNSVIGGTQLVPEYDSESRDHLIFENLKPKDIQFKTNLSSCSFKVLQNTSRQMIGFMIKTRLCDWLIKQYTDSQKNIIFDLQQRVVANMTLNKESDIDHFIKKLTSDAETVDETANFYEFGNKNAPLESLNCQSIPDYLSTSPNIHAKLYLQKVHNKHSASLLDELLDSLDKSKYQEHLKSLQDSLPADSIRTGNDVADDLFFNNPIIRCFDDLKRKKKSCQKLIILSLEQLESSWVHSRMMQILPMILKDKSAFEEYGKFFMDYDGRDEQTTFAVKLNEINLPDYASNNENLREFQDAKNSNSCNNRLVVNQIIEESHKDPNEKSVPVQHFIINFSKMILGNKIRMDMTDSKAEKLKTMTKYDMNYFIYRITRKYGKYIDQHDTIRAIIDHQFYSKTQKFFYWRFFGFVVCFVVPFLIQLFINGTTAIDKIGVLACNFVCFAQILYMAVQQQMYRKVVGMRKFHRNSQNNVDVALVVVYAIYFIIRINQNLGTSSATSTTSDQSTLPDKDNTRHPSPHLAISILLNVSITIICAAKLMIYLRVIESYGMLAQLVAQCLADVVPFTVFFFIWLLIFCVLYKVLGSQDNVTDSYPDIHPFFGYLFYNFENAVGNIQNPTFTYWKSIMCQEEGQKWTYKKYLAKILIYLIYLVWFFNQILVLIILLNFLIAVISQSYEDVMSSVIIFQYKQKAALNRECLIVYKALGSDKKIECCILSANTADESLNTKWYKFVQTVKTLLKGTMVNIKENVETNQCQLEQQIKQVKSELQQEIASSHDMLIKQVQSLIDNQEEANNRQ